MDHGDLPVSGHWWAAATEMQNNRTAIGNPASGGRKPHELKPTSPEPEGIMDEHTTRWHATVSLTEEDSETTADVMLETGTTTLHGHGTARRNPTDTENEGIGEELATGRALIKLGRKLLGITEQDLEHLEGHAARVHE